MKQIFFVTATNTNIGKTFASKKLILKYKDKNVGYFKPIETGVNPIPIDATNMLNLLKEINPALNITLDDICPYRFKLPASPFVAKDKEIDIDFLIEKKNKLLQKVDILIIEGAGGLMVPIKKNFFMIDLIKIFMAKAILITPDTLGCINDTLLSINALKNYNIDFSWYINLRNKENFEKTTLPFYKAYFKQVRYLDEI